jgi:hypothetical protein
MFKETIALLIILFWFVYLYGQILVLTQKQTTKMKKLFTLLFIAGAMSIVSCGPSAEEKAKAEEAEKAKMDSIFQANAAGMEAAPDSTATAAPDSAATAAPEEKK